MKLPEWGTPTNSERDARITLALALCALALFCVLGIMGWPGA